MAPRSESVDMYTEICIQLFQLIKVVPKQSGKVEYERERLLHGIANKLMNLLAIPSSLSRSYSTFPLCLGTTLIEIAVYIRLHVLWRIKMLCIKILHTGEWVLQTWNCARNLAIYRIVLYLNDFLKIKACLSATIKYERYINTNICGTNGHCPSLKGKLVNFGWEISERFAMQAQYSVNRMRN
jgi:hypothetical protein